LGLGILVVVFETTVQNNSSDADALAQRIANTMTMSALMIFLALISVIVLIARRDRQYGIKNELLS
jgi:predicted histidine transporter YuiF (NhaC family)